ncbi:glutathione hydrolase 1 proenzyme [Patella vulgata]|uniref:glutathione hydrolase 1 proenzyme n=1 Tax=Patella vulgata TaxID=6465 RepID=UPI0024A9E7C8|nr:glutathione hydrolase 1 proenzyme [Patella vulgata]
MSENNTPLYEEGEPLIYDPDFQHFHKERLKRKRRVRFFIALIVFLCLLFLLVLGLFYITTLGQDDEDNPGPSNSILGEYSHAAVASDVEECSKVGRDILEKKGSSVDSAIATLLCMCVADAQSMGIGGGFFMTIYHKSNKKAIVIDARETAPEKATQDMFVKDHKASQQGPLSIAVPGEIHGYWLAHQKYGKLPWKDLFQASIKMAKEGFVVPDNLAKSFQLEKDVIFKEKSLRKVFVNPDTGELYRSGEIMKRPELGATLDTISKEGYATFYNGSLSKLILEDLNEIKSIITENDLKMYRAKQRKVLKIKLNDGLKLYSPPPPSSGAVLSFILNILDGYKFISDDIDSIDSSVLTYHRMVEAFKFAYAKRTDLADEDFVDVRDLVANLTSRDYAEYIRSMIWDNQTHDLMYYGPTFYDKLTTSTAHLSVVDQDGNAVSVTSTVNAKFGSKLRGMRTGIIFNNEMDDFSTPNITNEFGIPPSPANFIKPGKRPLSSMCPAIAVDKSGMVKLVIGAAGGSRITTATAYAAMNVLWFGKNIKQSIDARRLHHQLLPPYISYETGFNVHIMNGLKQKGHNITEVKLGSSIVQGITQHDHKLYANCDFRKGGEPAGF